MFYYSSEKGSITFLFIASILPLMLLLLSLAIDLSSFLHTREHAQIALDEAALAAVKHLPYRNRASTYAYQALARLHSSDQLTVTTSGSSLSLTYASQFQPAFGGVLQQLVSEDSATTIPYTVRSEARLAPLHVAISVDTSAAAAPSAQGAPLWGSSINWPSAEFFLHDFEATRGNEPLARAATQRCFNPLLSRLKEAALSLYYHYVSMPSASVSLTVFPSRIHGVAFDEVRAPYYGATVSSQHCAHIATTDRTLHYHTPLPSSELDVPAAHVPAHPSSHTELSELTAAESPDTSILAAEALWFRPAHDDALTSLSQLVHELYQQLHYTAIPTADDSLSASAHALLILLLTEAPSEESAALHQELQALEDLLRRSQRSLTIAAVTVGDPYVRPCTDLQRSLYQLFLPQQYEGPHLSTLALCADADGYFVHHVSGSLAAYRKTGVLAQ